MKNKPLVSIIINNYNYQQFVGEAINSALNQTYPDIEVIVVDDGSTDNSREVIDRYGSRIIPVFKENGGQASAYNAGYTKMNGEYVCMLDSDDTLLPDAIEKVVARFEDNNVSKVQWPMWIVSEAGEKNGEVTAKWTLPQGNLKDFFVQEGPFYDFNLHVGSAYSRIFIEKVFPMPEPPYRNGADVYLTILAPIYGELRNCDEPLGTYRTHGSNNFFGRELDDNRIRNYIARFETNCKALHDHLNGMGIAASVESWRERNFNYLWPTRLLKAKADIASIVPEGDTYTVINEDEWGTGEHVPMRNSIPFPEREGEYGGPPADDASAIAEVERQKKAGIKYLVVWWTAFWWLEYYSGFAEYLKNNYKPIISGDHLIAYYLQT